MQQEKGQHTNCPNEDIKRSVLDVRCATEINELNITLSVENHILVLDISVDDKGFRMEMVDRLCNLNKDASAFILLHVNAKFDVVEEIHPRQPMRYHLNVVVDIVLKEISHFDDVRMFKAISSQVVKNMDFKRNSS